MYWLDRELAPGEKTKLTGVVPEPRRAGLVLESSRSGRLRLSAGEQPLLWARIERPYAGVWVLRRATADSPAIVPPIRAREARARKAPLEWMRHFAAELDRSARSPLSQGRWQLSELRRSPAASDVFAMLDPDAQPPARGLLAAPSAERLTFQEWGLTAPNEVFPLRAFSAPDAPRVKAWRKHARDGTLPAVLLWYVGGLEMPLLLDGHDRLRAAIAEGATPAVLALWQSVERHDEASDATKARAIERYEMAHRRAGALSGATRRGLNQALVRVFRRSWHRMITTARATPGLDESWLTQVRAELAGHRGDDAQAMLRAGADP